MTSLGEASTAVSCCHQSFTDPADVLFDKANLSFMKHLFFHLQGANTSKDGIQHLSQYATQGFNLPVELLGKKKH